MQCEREPAAITAAAMVKRRAGWAAAAKVREERAAEAAAEATPREKRLNMKSNKKSYQVSRYD
jgi:hypothetical protein